MVTADPATRSVRIALSGEIDIAVSEHLHDAVEMTLADRPDTVVVDFADVTFMDSTGLRFLVGFKTRCDSIGTTWVLEKVPASTMRLIDLSGLEEFLQPTR